MDVNGDMTWMTLLEQADKPIEPQISTHPTISIFDQIHSLDEQIEQPTIHSLDAKASYKRVCQDCNLPFVAAEGALFCHKCGREDTISIQDDSLQNALIGHDHNTSRNSFMSFKIVGKGSRKYQLGMMYICADSELYRINMERRMLYDFVYKYEGNTIPKPILDATLEMLTKIKQAGYIFRGNTKRGIWCACLAAVCAEHKISKTPHEIADILNVDDRFMAIGERKLQELAEARIITIPDKLRPLEDYNNQVFASLNIPNIYKKFIEDLINKAEKKHLYVTADMRMSTRCAGAVYILTRRIKSLRHITKDDIARETRVSKSTFIKYSTLIYTNHLLIKKVFKKHAIPMPQWWKTGFLVNESAPYKNDSILGNKSVSKLPKRPKPSKTALSQNNAISCSRPSAGRPRKAYSKRTGSVKQNTKRQGDAEK